MSIKNSFLLIIFIGLLTGCRHEFQDNTPFVQIDECTPSRDSMLQYYYFKPGTYWIYNEQTTGALDCLFVYESLDTVYQNGLSEFATYIYSVNDTCYYHYFQQSTDNFESWIHPPCTRSSIWVDKVRPGAFVLEGRFLFYPFTPDENIGNFSWHGGHPRDGRTTITDIMSNYVVGQDTLNRVVRFHVDVDNANFDNKSTYDIAKNIGFVRRTRHLEDSTYEEWKLIRWHIVQ